MKKCSVNDRPKTGAVVTSLKNKYHNIYFERKNIENIMFCIFVIIISTYYMKLPWNHVHVPATQRVVVKLVLRTHEFTCKECLYEHVPTCIYM